MSGYREYGSDSKASWTIRFQSFIQKQTEVTSSYVDTPCWLWVGWKDKDGYGRFSFPGKKGDKSRRHLYVHRLAYMLKYGPPSLTKDMDIDHLCYNQDCVRPSHLEAVTHEENIRRRTEKDRGSSH